MSLPSMPPWRESHEAAARSSWARTRSRQDSGSYSASIRRARCSRWSHRNAEVAALLADPYRVAILLVLQERPPGGGAGAARRRLARDGERAPGAARRRGLAYGAA